MVKLKELAGKLLRGHRKTAVFALTTRCNCKCVMCDIHKKQPVSISLEDAMKILDFLAENEFLIVYFTGGEPTLHPNVVEIVEYADKLNLVTAMTTNGTVAPEVIKRLKKAGLFVLSVSIDHWNDEISEKVRRHKGIKQKQERTIAMCKKIGLRTYTLTFLNPYVINEGVEKLIAYINERFNVPFGFCYPIKTGTDAYPLGGELSEKEISFNQLKKSVETILSLKRKGQAVANLGTYIEDVLNFYEGKTPNFYCKGGEDVVYIDWSGNVYPCFIKEKLFNILKDEKPRFLKNVKCNDCLTNCFREPSILAQLHPSLLMREALYFHPTREIFM